MFNAADRIFGLIPDGFYVLVKIVFIISQKEII